MRQNDIDERMRTIASQLTPIEMHSLAEFYSAGGVDANPAGRSPSAVDRARSNRRKQAAGLAS
jgi:hypothetical protein